MPRQRVLRQVHMLANRQCQLELGEAQAYFYISINRILPKHQNILKYV